MHMSMHILTDEMFLELVKMNPSWYACWNLTNNVIGLGACQAFRGNCLGPLSSHMLKALL